MPPPEISVVLPVRFAATTILPTLRALLDQCSSLPPEAPAEVIAIVSSTDPTRAVLHSFPADPRLRVLEIKGSHSVPQLR
jgi:glycosyltransferase involved in cell wall biosynthesis